MSSLGRTLMLFGAILLVVGALMTVVGRVPRLPGDILIRRDGLVVYIPLATSLVLSVLLTVVFSLLARR
ncbi:MAG: DUF2905 domain-containing protein [Armatimonadota bacterium]|nr:DUF2905 domain-containing protein [Armatimonadota bacterium]MDR7402381.1 DUF2905 domain-containing protein [Armatimonadota bacterium]MDR7404067.1 DUF2905 domain-containing protein [Armatimonadota bacterium]MDR7437597.1 DUF2905 domain-containing protein [Armatimonadota bacterium]MDR7472191.1 DUF2905 domain-containing protein [Armatimonadota bacterium]